MQLSAGKGKYRWQKQGNAQCPDYEWEQRERQRQKLIKKSSAWYRPQTHMGAFYPATSNSELNQGNLKVIEEEARRLYMKVWVVGKRWSELKDQTGEVRKLDEIANVGSQMVIWTQQGRA